MVEQQTVADIQSVKLQQPLKYVPSSVEKKRAIIMYMLFGVMMMFSKAQMSVFEFYHLAQAVGWWVVFILVLVLSVVLMFVPFIKYLGLIPLVVMVVMWMLMLKQAWDGVYYDKTEKNGTAMLASLGRWLLNLFDVDPQINGLQMDEIANINNVVGQGNVINNIDGTNVVNNSIDENIGNNSVPGGNIS